MQNTRLETVHNVHSTINFSTSHFMADCSPDRPLTGNMQICTLAHKTTLHYRSSTVTVEYLIKLSTGNDKGTGSRDDLESNGEILSNITSKLWRSPGRKPCSWLLTGMNGIDLWPNDYNRMPDELPITFLID